MNEVVYKPGRQIHGSWLPVPWNLLNSVRVDAGLSTSQLKMTGRSGVTQQAGES